MKYQICLWIIAPPLPKEFYDEPLEEVDPDRPIWDGALPMFTDEELARRQK